MAYARYKIKESDIEFYVCNDTNKLYEIDGSEMQFPKYNGFDYNQEKSCRSKSNKITCLKITLGHACNYDCSYCMQKDIGNPDERPKNKSLDTFIQNLSNYLDLTDLNEVQLWGGEPFLYWNDIVPIMQYLDKEDIVFYISTNGSTLMDKHIDFFNCLKGTVRICISHDGPGQESQRGAEIFHRERIKKIIKRMDNCYPKIKYIFRSVVSKYNYDLFSINKFFSDIINNLDLNNAELGYEIARTYEENPDHHYSFSNDCVISGEHLPKFKKILSDYLEEQRNQYFQYIDKLKNNEKSYYGCKSPLIPSEIFINDSLSIYVMGYLKSLLTGNPINVTTNCGADNQNVLSIDLDSNIRTCPHTGENHVFGRLNHLKGIRILSLNLTRKDTHCKLCPNKKLCKSSCPINLPDQSFYLNCGIEKIWYHEIQKSALNILFNGHVELLTSLYKGGIESISLEEV